MMSKWLKIINIILISGCLLTTQGKAQQLKGDSWATVKSTKKGVLWVAYANNAPFMYKEAGKSGVVAGVEYDLLKAFASFLKEKYQVDLQLRWKYFEAFKDCYNAAKNAKNGVLGASGISITDQRKNEVSFSPAYMPDIEILISSKNIPLFSQVKDFTQALPQLKAITVKNTTYEQNFKDLQRTVFPNLKYTYVDNSSVLLDSCIHSKSYWGYMSLPSYILAMKQGEKLSRQHFFAVVRQGMAFTSSLSSDWEQPFKEFFQQSNFQQIINGIINKYFGSFAADLIADALQSSSGKNKELAIATAEKKVHELLLKQQQEEIARKQQQARIAYLIVLVFLGLAGIVAWVIYNREKIKRKARKDLAQKNEEIAAQSENLQKSYQQLELISGIGKQILASLSIEDIIKAVYEHVLQLMPAEEFGIGIYDPTQEALIYEVYFYKGERLPVISVSVQEQNRLAVKCFASQKDIVMGDVLNEYDQYIQSLDVYNQNELLSSMICLPLVANDQPIGIISVQFSEKNAYSAHHVSILRNLAIYATIAIQNAQVLRQVEDQKKEIELQKNDITASIDYARQIQDAMLPTSENIQQYLPESFVLFKPRDIVSGDFYYFSTNTTNHKMVLAAVDCTGHGVPGAFMSLIGNDILNGIVEQEGITKADIVLNKLHRGVRNSLNQYNSSNRDGMDISLCVIDKQANTVEFAGAMNSLVYIQNGELKRLIGDKVPIGGEQREVNRKFYSHTIDISIPTTLYLYSDGYQDQFGGKDNRKFMAPRFRELLHSIHQKPMTEQKTMLESTLDNWQQDNEQLDDILVIGVQV
jgi:serine phosphatase RsbU (regulator of sigma subunit)/ABC-type amino acid transport substrate-binding protein